MLNSYVTWPGFHLDTWQRTDHTCTWWQVESQHSHRVGTGRQQRPEERLRVLVDKDPDPNIWNKSPTHRKCQSAEWSQKLPQGELRGRLRSSGKWIQVKNVLVTGWNVNTFDSVSLRFQRISSSLMSIQNKHPWIHFRGSAELPDHLHVSSFQQNQSITVISACDYIETDIEQQSSTLRSFYRLFLSWWM